MSAVQIIEQRLFHQQRAGMSNIRGVTQTDSQRWKWPAGLICCNLFAFETPFLLMQTINPNKAGLVFGALLALWHLIWAILVLAGWAQPLIDFIFWIHFIKPVFVIGTFNILTGLLLIIVTFSVGYGIGFVFGLLWNRIHR